MSVQSRRLWTDIVSALDQRLWIPGFVSRFAVTLETRPSPLIPSPSIPVPSSSSSSAASVLSAVARRCGALLLIDIDQSAYRYWLLASCSYLLFCFYLPSATYPFLTFHFVRGGFFSPPLTAGCFCHSIGRMRVSCFQIASYLEFSSPVAFLLHCGCFFCYLVLIYAVYIYFFQARFILLTARLFNGNFHPLEVVSRWRDTQLQVGENYTDLTKWRSAILKSCRLLSRYILNISKNMYLMCW